MQIDARICFSCGALRSIETVQLRDTLARARFKTQD